MKVQPTLCRCGREIRLVDGLPHLRWPDAGECFPRGPIVQLSPHVLLATGELTGWSEHHTLEKPFDFTFQYPRRLGVLNYAVALDRCGHDSEAP